MKINESTLDRLGMLASLACAVECVALPVILAATPLAGLSMLAGERWEWAFVVAALGIGLLSLCHGYIKHHRRRRVLALFSVGISLMLLTRLLLEESAPAEVPLVLTSASLIGGTHFLNLQLCRTHRPCHTGGQN